MLGLTFVVQVGRGGIGCNLSKWRPSPVGVVFGFFSDPSNLPLTSQPRARLRLRTARLAPLPNLPETNGNRASTAGMGSELVIAVRALPFLPRITWVARIVEFEMNRGFRDVQVRGTFREYQAR